MLYEVEFTDTDHDLLFTALIYACTVTECRENALSIAKDNNLNESYHMFIGECEL